MSEMFFLLYNMTIFFMPAEPKPTLGFYSIYACNLVLKSLTTYKKPRLISLQIKKTQKLSTVFTKMQQKILRHRFQRNLA